MENLISFLILLGTIIFYEILQCYYGSRKKLNTKVTILTEQLITSGKECSLLKKDREDMFSVIFVLNERLKVYTDNIHQLREEVERLRTENDKVTACYEQENKTKLRLEKENQELRIILYTPSKINYRRL